MFPVLIFNWHGSTHHQINSLCASCGNVIARTVLFKQCTVITWHLCVCACMHVEKMVVMCSKNMKLFLSQGLPGQPGSPGPAGKEGPVVSASFYSVPPLHGQEQSTIV